MSVPTQPIAPTREVNFLGNTTLARKWIIDVDTSPASATEPVWTGVYGVKEFKPTQETSDQDTSDYDSDGWKSSTNTALGWGAELTVNRKTQSAKRDSYDPGQEFLRLHSVTLGEDNRVRVRYYEYNGPSGPIVEAYEGYCSVAYEDDGGDTEATATATITLAGQGKRVPVEHPLKKAA